MCYCVFDRIIWPNCILAVTRTTNDFRVFNILTNVYISIYQDDIKAILIAPIIFNSIIVVSELSSLMLTLW